MTMTDTRDTYCPGCTLSYMRCRERYQIGEGLCCEGCSHMLTVAELRQPTPEDHESDYDDERVLRLPAAATASMTRTRDFAGATTTGDPDIAASYVNDSYFGVCPICGRNDGYINIGKGHWFYCAKHQVRWYEGTNLLSSWADQTIEEQKARYDELDFASFTEINTPPRNRQCETCGQPGKWKAL